jgi:hypothetical protein
MLFTAGVSTSGEAGKESPPEVTDKITLAKLLHGLASVYEKLLNLVVGLEARRYRDSSDDRGPPDFAPPPLTEADIVRLIREHGGGHVNWGNHTPLPPHKSRPDIIKEQVTQIIQKLLILAIGFVCGTLWNHETRISHLEGKAEVAHVGGP